METFRHYINENKVWFTSDLHLGHDKEFVWKARGFSSVGEMNETIIRNINDIVNEADTLYILGDLALCPIDEAKYWLSQIKCKNIVVIIGNHDTDVRIKLYEELGFKVQFGGRLRYGKYHFFLSHYPTLTANPGEDKLTLAHINLYGHTHHQYTWISDNPFAFQVGCDANLCEPIEITYIIRELKENIDMLRHRLI